MKKLFIYYSYSGNGDLISIKLSELGYDIRKVHVKKELPKPMFFRILIGGYKAMVNYKEKIIDFDFDISDYKEIVIGSPIWNDRLCSPISSVLDYLDLSDKKVKFILYSGSGEAKTASTFIKEKYNSEIIILKEPLKYDDELNKLSMLDS